jgi:hypothetical protein
MLQSQHRLQSTVGPQLIEVSKAPSSSNGAQPEAHTAPCKEGIRVFQVAILEISTRLPQQFQCVRSTEVLADSEQSPVCRFTPKGADIDSVIDVRAIFQQGHRDLKVEDLPSLLLPRKGRFGLIDYEKAYTPDLKSGLDIFELRAIDRERGAMVVVRPDQHVANVLPLDAHAELTTFFGRFMLDAP